MGQLQGVVASWRCESCKRLYANRPIWMKLLVHGFWQMVRICYACYNAKYAGGQVTL